MKKYLSYIFAAALTLGFTACEDIPAPYGINLDGNENGTDDGGDTATGDGSLANPFNSVAANKYAATLTSGSTSDGTYYIKGRVASVKESYNTSYGNGTFYISDDGSDDNTFYVYRAYYLGNKKFGTGDTQIEVGDSVVVCGKICNYNGTYETAQNTAYLYYLNGTTAGGDDEGGNDDEPITGTNLLTNSSFETWSGSTPEAWKSTTTASSATLSQSTDAHTGTYSVIVGGNENYNKRLASKEYTLKAGTYKLSAYIKGAGQIRLGYVPVVNGKVGDYAYATGYTNTSADSWTEATYQFTLDAQTTVNFVLMNPKTSNYAAASDKLVDDFTLVTDNGGLIDGGNDDDDDDDDTTPSTGDYLNETFASGKGAFTIDDKSLPAGSTYVWTAASSYKCMKASSYVGGANLAAESWLISPEINLTKAKSATLTFEQAGNYFKTKDNFLSACTIKVKTAAGNWTNLSVTSEASGSSWTFTSATADLSAYVGQKIQIAFAYTSTTEIAGTWEVKNVVVK